METLWDAPLVGDRGTTLGEALVAMLEPGEQFIRQVESLGQGLPGGHGVFAVPVLGRWLGERCCQAYRTGFVHPLATDPHRALSALVQSSGESTPDALVPVPV